MVGEFERIVLTRDLPEEGLVAGDAGTVVHVYEGGKGYEVEFIALSGRTLAVATVRDRLRPHLSQDQVGGWIAPVLFTGVRGRVFLGSRLPVALVLGASANPRAPPRHYVR